MPAGDTRGQSPLVPDPVEGSSFNGFSAYVTPQDGKFDENTPKTSVSDISDLISVRDFIDETIAQHNQGPINGRRTNPL